jgi:hypothetical protein
MKAQGGFRLVGIGIDVIETISIEGRGTADDSMDLVSLAEQVLGKVGTILARDARNKCFGNLLRGCNQR